MRHFLTLPITPPTLAPRMMQPTAKAPLIALARRTHALTPCLPGTGLATVALSMIATPADALLALTTRAIEYSVDDRTGSSLLKAGQLAPTASFSHWDKRYRRSAQTPRRLEEGNPRAFTFCRARPDYTSRLARARRREEEEQSQEDLRRRCFESGRPMAKNSGGVTRPSPDSRAFRQPFTPRRASGTAGRLATQSTTLDERSVDGDT